MIRIAKKQAKKSAFLKHRVGAVIVKGNRVISTGYNEIRYSHYLDKPTVHAEEAAVIKVLNRLGQHDLVGARIYVSRYTKAGHIGIAAPCSRCRTLLRSVGISSAVYTTDSGGVEEMKL